MTQTQRIEYMALCRDLPCEALEDVERMARQCRDYEASGIIQAEKVYRRKGAK